MEPRPGPVPDASGEPEPLAPEAPWRPWTVLGRLARAVREQNWFAVVLEVVIVIVGVVIGFQVTAWGQTRSDGAKEQTYLRQLVEDLRETERLTLRVDSIMVRRQYPAANGLLRTWGAPDRPPRDSVTAWLFGLYSAETVRPVLGTAEALVATGDLTLVRSDSLRTAITSYLDDSQFLAGSQVAWWERVADAWDEMGRRVDFIEPRLQLPDSAREAKAQEFLIAGLIPTGDWASPFPLDIDALYSDLEAYNAVNVAVVAQEGMGRDRAAMRERAAALRRRIEAELDR